MQRGQQASEAGSRRGTRRARARRQVLGAGAALAVAASCATPPSQTYRSIYQANEAPGLDSTARTQTAEIDIRQQVAQGSQYRIDDRVIHTDRDLVVQGNEVSTRELLHQPSAELLLVAGALRWIQGYELLRNQTRADGAPDNDLTRQDFREQLEWVPDDLPQVTTRFDYRTEEDDNFLDRETHEVLAEVRQDVGPFDYLYSYLEREIDNQRSSTVFDRRQQIFRGSYQDSHMDGRLRTSVSVFVDDQDSTTTNVLGGAEAEVTLAGNAGLFAVDSTPQVAVLQPNDALTDGDIATPTAINIGGFASGGVLDANIGVELPSGGEVDVLRLVTEQEVDPFLTGQFAFSVWASDDNEFWNLVASPAPYVYEAADRSFRITIPPVSTRFVKVVNTSSPAAAGAVLLTEMRVFSSVASAQSTSTRVENTVRNVSGRLSYRLRDNLTLTYDVLAQESDTRNQVAVTRDETRFDNAVGAMWSPTGIVDVNLRAQSRRTRDEVQPDRDVLFLNGRTVIRPLDTLDVNFGYSETRREQDGVDEFDTRSAQAGVSAQLLDTLTSELIYSVSDQDDFLSDRQIQRHAVRGIVTADLSRVLEVTVGVRNEDATVTGPGAGGIPDPSEERYELTVVYQPSSQLTADATVEWVDTFAGYGLDQRYRLDWIPFQDGKLDLQMNYDRTAVESVAQERIDRYQAVTRWTFNPRAFLEVNWASQVPEVGPRSDLLTASVTVTL